jgi:hypothetical protein
MASGGKNEESCLGVHVPVLMLSLFEERGKQKRWVNERITNERIRFLSANLSASNLAIADSSTLILCSNLDSRLGKLEAMVPGAVSIFLRISFKSTLVTKSMGD